MAHNVLQERFEFAGKRPAVSADDTHVTAKIKTVTLGKDDDRYGTSSNNSKKVLLLPPRPIGDQSLLQHKDLWSTVDLKASPPLTHGVTAFVHLHLSTYNREEDSVCRILEGYRQFLRFQKARRRRRAFLPSVLMDWMWRIHILNNINHIRDCAFLRDDHLLDGDPDVAACKGRCARIRQALLDTFGADEVDQDAWKDALDNITGDQNQIATRSGAPDEQLLKIHVSRPATGYTTVKVKNTACIRRSLRDLLSVGVYQPR